MSGCLHNRSQHEQAAGSYPVQNLAPGAKWIKNLTQDRLGQFTGGHFGDVNLSSVLFTHRHDDAHYVSLQVWSAPGLTKPTFSEAMQQKFRPAKKGDSFGPSWTNHWWKVSVKIPSYWTQYERVQFEFDPGCEAMIFTTDGTPLQGITGGYGGDRRVEYIIPKSAVKDGKHEFVIESSCNGMFGVPWNGDTIAPPDMNRFFRLASADLVVPNQEAWRLLWDFHTLKEIVQTLPGNTSLQNKALVAANEIMNVFDSGDLSSISAARKVAEGVFGEGWDKKGDKVYEEGAAQSQIWGIGHCHIDTAWLWPYRVTQQKVARSWSTQIDLMERYPEHRFAASSAQQYKWLEQQYPSLFERIKDKVHSGQFYPIGGSWVENDSNMPSGEALARQFIFGQRFFESRFGKRCETAWLPDSFGYTGAFPQLMRLAGMKYFFTQKLSWNNINVFPHSTFNWVGIDGTQVLCHMTPVDTYTAQATVGDVQKGVTNNKNLESNDLALLVFGNGDGGGGPLNKMLENLRRIRAAANESRELPSVSMGRSVDDFFEAVENKTNHGSKLPTWHGELYFEFHRGTYTSHGSIKKGNRKSEILLRDVELVTTLASLLQPKKGKYVYPKAKIDESWEKVLLNQFHDVLPGSSIGMVYEDAEKLYAEVKKDGKDLIEEAFDSLFHKSYPLSLEESLPSAAGASGNIVAFNPTFLPRRDVMKVPLAGSGGTKLRGKVVQSSKNGSVGYALMEGLSGAGIGYSRGLFADCMPATAVTTQSGDVILRNSSVQLTICHGRITSLRDVQLGRELIPAGQTGGMVIFDDRPGYWDAWDVEIHHLETRRPLEFCNVRVVSDGPLRASIEAEVLTGKSTVKVTISLDAVTATTRPESRSLLRFDAKVDWYERHKFIKFEVPLNIHNDFATYETQFGWVQRPTHKNTTWDAAKFEVCGHKFADLSEYGYGVAILSESKYGFACEGNVLRISLLRAATAPDAEQDQGQHEFSWAVMPHEGHFLQSDVPQAAYLFNSPLHLRYVPETSMEALAVIGTPPFVIENAQNVMLETVKRGEADSFDPAVKSTTTIVLRLYEALGGHAHAHLRISSAFSVAKAYITNLLEDNGDELNIIRADDSDDPDVLVMLDFHGFEIKTVKLVLGAAQPYLVEQSPKRESWISIDKTRFFG